MKKFISIFLSVVFCFSMFLTVVSAFENDIENINNDIVSNSESIPLISKNMIDGTITEWVFNTKQSRAYSGELSIPPTYPTNFTEDNNMGIMPLENLVDNRVHLTGSQVIRAVGYLYCEFDFDKNGVVDKVIKASASLQINDIIISCAHAVWKKSGAGMASDGWATNIKFYAGEDSEGNYVEMATGLIPTISQLYVNNTTVVYDNDGTVYDEHPDFQNDCSIIQVDKNLTPTCGGLGLHGCGDPELDKLVYLVGYPDDKGNHEQWRSSGRIVDFVDNIMYYTSYNATGFSGGPIIDSSYFVYGINTHMNPSQSGGTRMSPGLFDLIVQCRTEAEERWR